MRHNRLYKLERRLHKKDSQHRGRYRLQLQMPAQNNIETVTFQLINLPQSVLMVYDVNTMEQGEKMKHEFAPVLFEGHPHQERPLVADSNLTLLNLQQAASQNSKQACFNCFKPKLNQIKSQIKQRTII